ncbi:MAG: hypothetical protein VB027_08555 [Gordonibacter sp.]|nr:hypothetical protein [Gordonibacter sp.]
MEKSGSRKALKVISIIMIVFSVLGVISSLFLLIGGGSLGIAGADAADDAVAVAGGLAMILGFGILLSALFNLLIGIFGVRGANNPNKIGVFFVLAIVGVIFALINAISMFLIGDMEVSSVLSTLFSFVLPVVCVVLANNIRNENTIR